MKGKNQLFILFLALTMTYVYSQVAQPSKTKPKTKSKKSYERGAGILMHITSLPSNYGIGTLGEEALNFVDFLVKAKQKYWQILPINPTSSFGNSPYNSLSTYAGNPYLIDIDYMKKEGFFENEDLSYEFFYPDVRRVDFYRLFRTRYALFLKAFKKIDKQPKKWLDNFKLFKEKEKNWLDDYAIFMALKERFYWKSWLDWPNDIKNREESALKKMINELKDKIEFYKFLQYEFDMQFTVLKNYCVKKGIKLIGDVPIYVSLDSVDVWVNRDLFQLDENGTPKSVGGVPPFGRDTEGQKWGTPLYDWDQMKKINYKWHIARLKNASKKFDVIRLDHFKGFETYWSIKNDEKEAKNGEWKKGPGIPFIEELKKNLPNTEFIVEDLGFLNKDVLQLRKKSGFPGIKVLQYAFDSDSFNPYLPYNHIKNSVCYIGTHDDSLLNEWENEISPKERGYAESFFALEKGSSLRLPMIRAGMASTSYLFIVQIQDYLGLDKDSRFNTPGTNDLRNWRWRAKKEDFTDELIEFIADLTTLYER